MAPFQPSLILEPWLRPMPSRAGQRVRYRMIELRLEGIRSRRFAGDLARTGDDSRIRHIIPYIDFDQPFDTDRPPGDGPGAA